MSHLKRYGCGYIFVILANMLVVGIYLILISLNKTDYELSILKSKTSSCITTPHSDKCYVYFDMLLNDNTNCFVTQDNSTYNDYLINATYKIKDVNINNTSCNFGEEKYKNEKQYQIGLTLLLIFFIVLICICAFRCVPYSGNNDSTEEELITYV